MGTAVDLDAIGRALGVPPAKVAAALDADPAFLACLEDLAPVAGPPAPTTEHRAA
ncbi:MAG: hypothetical protein ACTHJH_01990 [Marmoricola sp.]